MERYLFFITELDENQRIDKYLKKILKDAPLSLIYRLIRKHDVKVNQKKVAENYILQSGDEVSIYLLADQANEFITPYAFVRITKQLNIIYEDENIIVINKERGLPVHATKYEKKVVLTNIVLTYLEKKGEFAPDFRGYVPSPVARIDEETAGIIVFCKKLSAHQALSRAYHDEKSIIREYRVLVHGIIREDHKTISLPLVKEGGRVKVKDEGKKTATKYEIIATSAKYTYVKALLLTGFSNQIRVHFATLNHPVVGDKKYGQEDGSGFMTLNAHALTFYKLPPALAYLNGQTFIADNTKQLLKLLEEDK